LPNIKSAMKRVKISEQQNLRNRMTKSAMKTSIKKFEAAVDAKDANAQQYMQEAVKLLDKAAAKNVIHKNAANNKKAQLARKLRTIS